MPVIVNCFEIRRSAAKNPSMPMDAQRAAGLLLTPGQRCPTGISLQFRLVFKCADGSGIEAPRGGERRAGAKHNTLIEHKIYGAVNAPYAADRELFRERIGRRAGVLAQL